MPEDSEERPWDDGLTGAGLDVAASNANRLKVTAGPGTGKSFALKRRVRVTDVSPIPGGGADPKSTAK